MRLFIALEFPEPIRKTVASAIHQLAHAIADPQRRLHWVKDEQLHVTLKFLGETPERRLPALHQALQEAVRLHARFFIRLGGVGHFGGRVIWLGVQEGKEPLAALAGSVDKFCSAAGFLPESRPFRPHVTLARSKINPGAIRLSALPSALTEVTAGPCPVTHVSLIQSTLAPSGALYQTLERIPLAPPGETNAQR